ncbi:nuclear transport factor 2 family protein [Tumebacillus algifaecis]|nr:nuclear transport factor 2 family protein [Tumebacillus algifaecis]
MTNLDLTLPAQRQLEAYNRGDIEAFMACYAPDVVVEDAAGNVMMQGWDAMYKSYAHMFAQSPDLHCTLVSRIVVGNYVLDEENVTGRPGTTEMSHVVAVYQIADGLIQHVRFIR